MKTFTTIYARDGYPAKSHKSLADALRYALSTNYNGMVIRLTENGTVLGSTRTDLDPPGMNCCTLGFDDDDTIKYSRVSNSNPVSHFRFDHMIPSLTQLAVDGYDLGDLAGIPTK